MSNYRKRVTQRSASVNFPEELERTHEKCSSFEKSSKKSSPGSRKPSKLSRIPIIKRKTLNDSALIAPRKTHQRRFSVPDKTPPKSPNKKRLYEENMLLKLNCQASQNELMLLKTQISQLQNLLHEKEDLIEKVKNNKGFSENFSGNNLIANLKSAKSNLTKELESKNSSLAKLKKNSKSTANNEIEIELSAYKEEFERLKTMLSDLESSPTFLETLENENHKKAIIIEQLKKDNQEIALTIEHQKQALQKAQKKAERLMQRESKLSYENEIEKIKAEIAEKQELLETRKKNYSKKVEEIKQEITKRKQKIEITDQVLAGQQSMLQDIKKQTLDQESISLENYSLETFLKHFQYRLQLNRVLKKNYKDLFEDIGQEVHIDQLCSQFRKEPLLFTDSSYVKKVIWNVLGTQTTWVDTSGFFSNLDQLLEDWRVFSLKDEENFDKELRKLITDNKSKISDFCKKQDPENTGVVNCKVFAEALSKLNLELRPEVAEYSNLLFYSYKFELDLVPYKSFVDIYGRDADSDCEDFNEELFELVRNYIEEIAKKLREHKTTIEKVFKPDLKGLIYPERFKKGLSFLGLKVSEENQEVIIKCLRDEDHELDCLKADELEQILGFYLDKTPRNKEELEYSEDSPRRYSRNSIVSDGSPFRTVSASEMPVEATFEKITVKESPLKPKNLNSELSK